MHIKAGDTVQVISGGEKGQRGKVLRVNRKTGRALVEGVNRVLKHVKKSQKHPQGGRLQRENPLDISNLQLVCPACSQKTRTGIRLNGKEEKERYCKKCDATVSILSVRKDKASV